MNGVKYSFVIPVYNEKNNILPTIKSIKKNFDNYSTNYEILFIDDNSPDNTAGEVQKCSMSYNNVKLIQHGNKEGMGAAILYGYQHSTGKIILGIDADLSQSSKDFLHMIEKINQGYDMVVGSRYIKGGKQINKSFMRDLGSRFMNLLASIILNLKLKDSTHTFRAFKKEIVTNIANKISEKGHPSFLIEFTYFAKKNNYKITELPIIFTEREENRGNSKVVIYKELFPFFKTIMKLFLFN